MEDLSNDELRQIDKAREAQPEIQPRDSPHPPSFSAGKSAKYWL